MVNLNRKKNEHYERSAENEASTFRFLFFLSYVSFILDDFSFSQFILLRPHLILLICFRYAEDRFAMRKHIHTLRKRRVHFALDQ